MPPASKRVFINCPFDDAFKPIFEAVLFAVLDCGFSPCSALEEDDSGDVRFSKILRLIRGCQFGIHDISRTELDEDSRLPRFSMPFELGVFLGVRYSSESRRGKKNCLILDRNRHRYQRFLSDIAGQDIRSHEGSASQAIACVRDWLRTSSGRAEIPGSDEIVRRYARFQADLPELCKKQRLTPQKLIFTDLRSLMSQWLRTIGPILDGGESGPMPKQA